MINLLITLEMLIPLESNGGIGRAIMSPLYWAISGLLKVFHSIFTPLFGYNSGVTWVCAIALLTIVVRSLLLPLYVKQLNSSRAMQTLQPKMKALQEKYGSDRERLGVETQKLYKDEGVNPMASCLPLLLQLPIFWALFRVLNGAARNNPIGYWFETNQELVDSLSNANIFGAQLSGTLLPLNNGIGATQILAVLLILAMTGLLFWQQIHMLRRNMPPSAMEGPMGQQQKMMLYMMPFMYFISGPIIPVGVLVYWLFSNIWTMGQQYIIIRTYPTPGTPAYIEWEDRMVAKGKDPKEIEARRANKARRNPKLKTTPVVTDASGKAKVARQGRNRSTTVQNSESNERHVQRQQTQRLSRAARKKKK